MSDLAARVEAIIREKVWATDDEALHDIDIAAGHIAALIAEEAKKARLQGYAERAGEIVTMIDSAREAGRREGLEAADKRLSRWEWAPDGYVYAENSHAKIAGWNACAAQMLKAIRALATEPRDDR